MKKVLVSLMMAAGLFLAPQAASAAKCSHPLKAVLSGLKGLKQVAVAPQGVSKDRKKVLVVIVFQSPKNNNANVPDGLVGGVMNVSDFVASQKDGSAFTAIDLNKVSIIGIVIVKKKTMDVYKAPKEDLKHAVLDEKLTGCFDKSTAPTPAPPSQEKTPSTP